MRQCEIKDIKFYQARTKVIALGGYWVTIIFFCQINLKIHCSPGMHDVQGITKILSYKSVKASWKLTIFCSFLVQFLLITCFCSQIYLKNKLHVHTLHTFLAMQYCQPFMTSAFTLPGKSKKPKKVAVKLVSTKSKHFGVS